MGPALLVLAAAVKVFVPAVEAENVPPVLVQRLGDWYAQALQDAGCAEAVPFASLGPQAREALDRCFGARACLGTVARQLGASYVLIGRVSKLDAVYTTYLEVYDAQEHVVRRTLKRQYSGPMKGLDATARALVPEVCAIVAPDVRIASAASVADELPLELGDLELALPPTPVVAPPPPAPAAVPEAAPTIATTAPAPAVIPPPAATPAPPLVFDVPTPPPAAPMPPKVAPIVSKVAPPPSARPSSLWFPDLPGPASPTARRVSVGSAAVAGAGLLATAAFGLGAMSAAAERRGAVTVEAYDAADAALHVRATGANASLSIGIAAMVAAGVSWWAGDAIFGAP